MAFAYATLSERDVCEMTGVVAHMAQFIEHNFALDACCTHFPWHTADRDWADPTLRYNHAWHMFQESGDGVTWLLRADATQMDGLYAWLEEAYGSAPLHLLEVPAIGYAALNTLAFLCNRSSRLRAEVSIAFSDDRAETLRRKVDEVGVSTVWALVLTNAERLATVRAFQASCMPLLV